MTEVQTPNAPVQTPEQSAPPRPAAPKKKSNKKKMVKRIIAIVVTLAILAGIVFGVWFVVFRKTEAQGQIYAESTYIGSIQSTVQGSGNASAKESATIVVPAGGVVQQLMAASGDVVMAGQPLFSIYSQTAEDALAAAEKAMAELNEKINGLTLTAPFSGKLIEVTEFNPGDHIGENQTVGTLVNDQKLKLSLYFSYAYEGQIQVGQAVEVSVPVVMFTTASGVVERINRVNYISPEGGTYFEVVIAFDNPGTLTADMAASAVIYGADGSPMYPYDGGKTEYYETRKLTTEAGGPLVQSNLLNYASVYAGQPLLTMGAEDLDAQITAAQEALAKAQADMETLNAVSPIDGTITSCTLAEGGEVKAGDAVITISNTTKMVVTIQVDDRNIGFIKLGDMITLNDYNGNSYMGTVTNVETKGEIGQGMSTFPVTLEVENPGGDLYAGAWLDYSFVTKQSQDCVLAPTTAVKSVIDDQGNKQMVAFVYREERPENAITLDPSIVNVPTEADHYYPVPVETGISGASEVEIVSGLEAGEMVFINYVSAEGGGSYDGGGIMLG